MLKLVMFLRSAPNRTPVSRRELDGHILRCISIQHFVVGGFRKENSWIMKQEKRLEVKKKCIFDTLGLLEMPAPIGIE